MRTAIFPGESTQVQQLSKIFNVMGTPSEDDWPGVTLLPEYMEFEKREPLDMKHFFRRSSDSSHELPADYDLLLNLLQLNPKKRLSAEEVLFLSIDRENAFSRFA